MLMRISVASGKWAWSFLMIRLALEIPEKMEQHRHGNQDARNQCFPTDHREEVIISLELYSTLISIPGFFSEYSAISFFDFLRYLHHAGALFFWMEILIFSMPSLFTDGIRLFLCHGTLSHIGRWTTLPAAVIIGTCSSFCTVLNSMAALSRMSLAALLHAARGHGKVRRRQIVGNRRHIQAVLL